MQHYTSDDGLGQAHGELWQNSDDDRGANIAPRYNASRSISQIADLFPCLIFHRNLPRLSVKILHAAVVS